MSSYDKLVASVIDAQRRQRAAMRPAAPLAAGSKSRVDWSKVDEGDAPARSFSKESQARAHDFVSRHMTPQARAAIEQRQRQGLTPATGKKAIQQREASQQAAAEQARGSVQTGARGGQFYISATGAKVYVKR